MPKTIVGVMGAGDHASLTDQHIAYTLGQQIAQQGWILLTGGRNVGVMDAASRGAKQAHGLTIGILPTAEATNLSDAIDIPILTGMGNARNVINILTSQIVIACGMGAGTASEIALALKANKPVILLNVDATSIAFFQQLAPDQIFVAQTPEDAIAIAHTILQSVS